MSSLAEAPEGSRPGAASRSAPTSSPPPAPGLDLLLALVVAAGLFTLALTTGGGVSTTAAAGDTWSEIGLMLLGAGAIAAGIVRGRAAHSWGRAAVSAMAALTVLTAASIAWSVQPEYSWQATGQMLAYLAVFAGAAAVARVAPGRWPALVAGVAVAATALAAYALIAKVFPATLDSAETISGGATGRLQVPFGYWNAIGVVAAMGLPASLWIGTRRTTGRPAAAFAAPAVALQVAVVVLSFSRSAALAAVVAILLWLAFVPLRLRTVALLVVGVAGGAAISGWSLARPALSADGQPLAARVSAGHTFGVVIVVVLACIAGGGVALSLAQRRVALSDVARRRIGGVLLGLVALALVGAVAALAVSHRGLTGEVSHAWSRLTSTNPQVGNSSGRLLQLGNSRAIYWREGLAVGEHAPLAGVGAEAFGVATTAHTASSLPVGNAHSYVIETFADLGVIGLVVSLALLIAWAGAAAGPLAPRSSWRGLSSAPPDERTGMWALAVVAVAFGVQSAIDWTWYFTAVAVPALLCAGWLAGRGPLAEAATRVPPARPRRPLLARPGAVGAMIGLTALTLAAAWMTWQPLRSADALSAAIDAGALQHTDQAFADARRAAAIDPVSVEPLWILASLYAGSGDVGAARAELRQAVDRQPDNPRTWLQLGDSYLAPPRADPRLALWALTRAARLDLGDPVVLARLAQARQELAVAGSG